MLEVRVRQAVLVGVFPVSRLDVDSFKCFLEVFRMVVDLLGQYKLDPLLLLGQEPQLQGFKHFFQQLLLVVLINLPKESPLLEAGQIPLPPFS